MSEATKQAIAEREKRSQAARKPKKKAPKK